MTKTGLDEETVQSEKINSQANAPAGLERKIDWPLRTLFGGLFLWPQIANRESMDGMNKLFGIEISWMSKRAKTALYCYGSLFVLLWIGVTLWQISLGSYGDAAAEILVCGYFFVVKFYWPLWAATDVRLRGGRFGRWFAYELVLAILFGGLLYMAVWSKKPKLSPLPPPIPN